MVIPSTLKADTALPFSLKSILSKKQTADSDEWEVAIEMSEPVKVHTFALYSHDFRVGGGEPEPGSGAASPSARLLLHLALLGALVLIV
jgi:hypothetical protein